jgi:hypothetical protein
VDNSNIEEAANYHERKRIAIIVHSRGKQSLFAGIAGEAALAWKYGARHPLSPGFEDGLLKYLRLWSDIHVLFSYNKYATALITVAGHRLDRPKHLIYIRNK